MPGCQTAGSGLSTWLAALCRAGGPPAAAVRCRSHARCGRQWSPILAGRWWWPTRRSWSRACWPPSPATGRSRRPPGTATCTRQSPARSAPIAPPLRLRCCRPCTAGPAAIAGSPWRSCGGGSRRPPRSWRARPGPARRAAWSGQFSAGPARRRRITGGRSPASQAILSRNVTRVRAPLRVLAAGSPAISWFRPAPQTGPWCCSRCCAPGCRSRRGWSSSSTTRSSCTARRSWRRTWWPRSGQRRQRRPGWCSARRA